MDNLENVLYKTRVLDGNQEFTDFLKAEPNAYNRILMTAPKQGLGYMLKIESAEDGTKLTLHGVYDSRRDIAYDFDNIAQFVRDNKAENSFPNDQEVERRAAVIRKNVQSMFDREFDGNPQNLPSKGRYQLVAVLDDNMTLSTIQNTANRMSRCDRKFADPLTNYVLKQQLVIINKDIASEKKRLEELKDAVESAILQNEDEGMDKSYQFKGAPTQARAHPTPVPQASSTYVPGLDEIAIPDDEIILGEDERLWVSMAMSDDKPN